MTNQRGQFYTEGNIVAQENSAFMTRVYQWMMIGVLITGFISAYIGNDEQLVQTLVMNRGLFWGAIIAQFAVVMAISFLRNRLTVMTCLLLFFLYSAITGVTLSFIFLMYTAASIQSAFFTTAIGFGGLSMFGFVTKKDLGPVGTFCTMGLFGMLGFALLSLFFPSILGGRFGFVYSLMGLLVFSGLTAYDTQKIKMIGRQTMSEDEKGKAQIFGALSLYLDFINMFMYILRLMGDRRR